MHKREIRFGLKPELRAQNGSPRRITGYAAVFNTPVNFSPTFREVILPGTFRRSIASGADVRALVRHDASKVVGRTKAGTLKLSEDGRGLFAEIFPADTQVGRDLVVSVERGDLDQMSFQGRFTGEREEKSGNVWTRSVTEVELLDVSVVAFPVYESTSAEVRARSFPDGVPACVARHVCGSGGDSGGHPANADARARIAQNEARFERDLRERVAARDSQIERDRALAWRSERQHEARVARVLTEAEAYGSVSAVMRRGGSNKEVLEAIERQGRRLKAEAEAYDRSKADARARELSECRRRFPLLAAIAVEMKAQMGISIPLHIAFFADVVGCDEKRAASIAAGYSGPVDAELRSINDFFRLPDSFVPKILTGLRCPR